MDKDFAYLYEKYAPMVYRRCLSLLRDEAKANDAMHDVFVKAMQNKTRLDWRGPSSFLYTVATHVCIDAIRKQATRTKFVEDGSEDILDTIAHCDQIEDMTHASKVLDWLFNRHPDTSKTIAVMHFVDGLTLQEVAQELGMSASGVRKRIYKMKDELKKHSEQIL